MVTISFRNKFRFNRLERHKNDSCKSLSFVGLDFCAQPSTESRLTSLFGGEKFKLTTSWVLTFCSASQVRRDTDFWHHDLFGRARSSLNSIFENLLSLDDASARAHTPEISFSSLRLCRRFAFHFNIANKRCHFVETSSAHFTRCHERKI